MHLKSESKMMKHSKYQLNHQNKIEKSTMIFLYTRNKTLILKKHYIRIKKGLSKIIT